MTNDHSAETTPAEPDADAGAGPLRTPLYDLHRALGAKMVPFAGYAMPVQYPLGVLGEHLHTRAAAGLFDVSHMGQVTLRGPDAAKALETLVPGDIQGLGVGRIRYTLFTNDQGGVRDDLMVTNFGDHLVLVVNAACKTQDIAHLKAHLADRLEVVELADRALVALQGPGAAAAMAVVAPDSAAMAFMSARAMVVAGVDCLVSRSGYTGEDGFEISVPADRADALARALLALPGVAPVGLGARDSLRLEAGLCLYGADLDPTTTPVEAALTWTLSKRRRAEDGFPGASVVQCQLRDGPARLRVGIRPAGNAPARAHTVVTDIGGRKIGEVTSGGFGPSLGGPLAMAYVEAAFAAPGTEVLLVVRGVPRAARVTPLPFVPNRYKK